MVIILLLTVLMFVLCIVLVAKKQSEGFQADMCMIPYYTQKKLLCDRLSGCITTYNGVPVCKLPDVITNNEILNWQLAGRYCDLDRMIEGNGCVTPWVEQSPYTQSANRGFTKWTS